MGNALRADVNEERERLQAEIRRITDPLAENMLKLRVLIVDLQDYIRRGLRAFLADEPGVEVCGEAVNGGEAIAKTQALRPDLVIMHISMPIVDGLRATRVIR